MNSCRKSNSCKDVYTPIFTKFKQVIKNLPEQWVYMMQFKCNRKLTVFSGHPSGIVSSNPKSDAKPAQPQGLMVGKSQIFFP